LELNNLQTLFPYSFSIVTLTPPSPQGEEGKGKGAKPLSFFPSVNGNLLN
jgi:hypothetical protein